MARLEVFLLAVTYRNGRRRQPHRRGPGSAELPAVRRWPANWSAPWWARCRTPIRAAAGSTTPSMIPYFVAAWLELIRNGGTAAAGNAAGYRVAVGLPPAYGHTAW